MTADSIKKPIPNEKECLEIMESCNMFPNIITHSITVKNVAEAIMLNLKEGVSLNRPLITAGALLHDIAKSKSITEHLKNHDVIGAEMLNEMGYPEIAEICASHVMMKNFNPDGPLEEREVVHYADKRVKHSNVVSLDERIKDLVERYGTSDNSLQMIRREEKFAKKLETKIQSFMKIGMSKALTDL